MKREERLIITSYSNSFLPSLPHSFLEKIFYEKLKRKGARPSLSPSLSPSPSPSPSPSTSRSSLSENQTGQLQIPLNFGLFKLILILLQKMNYEENNFDQ